MFATPPYDQQLLDAPLWHVEFPEATVCVAENREGTFLVLFTSPARAYEFVSWKALGDRQVVSPTLYSVSRNEFLSRAGSSAANGVRGVVVDPQADGCVGRVIEFLVVAE